MSDDISVMKRLGDLSLIFAVFWLSLTAAWFALSVVDFGYGALYEVAGIGDNIDQYGPQNRYKLGLEKTTRFERERIFGEIVRGVNASGEGLSAIVYHDPSGSVIGTFLRQPEIVHLTDVARLLDRLKVFSAVSLVIVGGLLSVYYVRRYDPPRLRDIVVLLGLFGFATLAGMGVAGGATAFFYALHEVVFPPSHQWFFYYQDSLMTTLMKAPVIFGYIAVFLSIAALLLFALMWAAMVFLLRRRQARST